MITIAKKFFDRLVHDEAGLTAVEYAVLGGLVVAAVATVGGTFRTDLIAAFGNLL